jgi:hypothetical protein
VCFSSPAQALLGEANAFFVKELFAEIYLLVLRDGIWAGYCNDITLATLPSWGFTVKGNKWYLPLPRLSQTRRSERDREKL